MVIVCQHCGDKGFHDALTLCQKCGECAVHRYCLEELPDDLSEDVIWFCEDCRPDISKQSTFDKASSSLSRFSVSEEVESPKTVQPSKCRSSYKKNGKIIASSETKTEVKTYDGRSPSDDEPLCREKCDKDQKLGRKRRLILDDEEDQPLETSQVAVSISTASNIVERRVTTGSVANTEWQMCEGRPFGNDSQLREKCDNEQKLRKERRLFLENEETNTLGQRVHTTCTVAEVEAHICDSRTSSNKLPYREETVKDQQLKRGAEGQMCEGRPFGNDSQLRENCDNELKLGKESRLVLEDEEAKPSNTLEQRVFTTRTVAEAEVQICDGRSSSNKSTCKEESDKDKQLKRGQKTFQCSDLKPSHILQHKIIAGSMDKTTVQISDVGPCGEMPWSIEKCDNDCELTKRQSLVLSDEEGEPVKTSQVAACHRKPSNILQEKDITGSVAKTKVRTRDGRSFGSEQQSREKYDEHENLRKQRKTSKVSDPRPLNICQLKVVTGTVAKTKVHKRDGSPCSVAWYRGKCDKCQKLGEQRKTSEVSDRIPLNILQQKAITSSVAEMKGQKYDIRPYRSEPEYRGKYYEDQKFQKKQRVLEDDKEDKPLKTSQADVNDPRLSNVLEQNYYLEVRPVIDPIWKGSLSIWSKDLNSLDRLLVYAHLSNLACLKVLEVAMLLPRVISFELSNRSHIWPKSFQKLGPTYHHIALYFFPVNRRDDNIFDSLVSEMIHQDLAMRAVLKEAELLVFTSHALPMHIRRFRTKYYLWGVFRRKQA